MKWQLGDTYNGIHTIIDIGRQKDDRERAALLHEVLIRLNTSITFDGLITNLAMCRTMGADFDEGNAYIINPAKKDHKIYILLDHMLKLARNCLGTRNLVNANRDVIEWKYIQLLYETQRNLSYNLGNKLSKAHMEWESKKISVKLAGETLSKSVADSIEFLVQENELFKNAETTAYYIRICNDVFAKM